MGLVGAARLGLHLHLLADLLKSWHPRFIQMTVLEQNPRAVLPCICDKLLSNVTLVLTKRQAFHGFFLVFERCELLKLLIGVCARQDENERCSWSRVLE